MQLNWAQNETEMWSKIAFKFYRNSFVEGEKMSRLINIHNEDKHV